MSESQQIFTSEEDSEGEDLLSVDGLLEDSHHLGLFHSKPWASIEVQRSWAEQSTENEMALLDYVQAAIDYKEACEVLKESKEKAHASLDEYHSRLQNVLKRRAEALIDLTVKRQKDSKE